ncbi:succinylglutamate desuccinylase/aspartoacylase family protein [Noviherbaspirillum saxi]|nr:succinylglutamate desuccinylase/aspartoacylase family protein [Noviherbaspirillum saxi]
MTVKTVVFHALEDGPALTVLGAVHGNERCGPAAINRLIADLENGKVRLKRGRLQLMPVVNPQAYAQNVRFVERNLNRQLYRKDEKQHYEDHLDPIVCDLLDRTDVLLDLHSFASPGGPFIFLSGKNPRELAYAKSLGVTDFVYGWAEAYGGGGSKESQGTTEYARTQGALAVTLECGQHQNADAPDIGYQAILHALAHFDMLADAVAEPAPSAADLRCVRMKSVFYRDAGANFCKSWRHFDPVAKGEAIATLADGSLLTAPEDGFLVLPKEAAVTGGEWFYFGTATAYPE